MSDGENLSTILRVFRDGETFERMAAASALQSMGEPAVPGLVDSLGHQNPAVRASAARLLGEVPLSDTVLITQVINALVDSLADSEVIVRWHGAASISHIAREHLGKANHVAEPLIALLADDSSPHVSVNKTVSEQAAAALRAIGTEEAKDAVETWWGNQDDDW